MTNRNPIANVGAYTPITLPRHLDEVPCSESFERIRFPTSAFYKHKAVVVASGEYEGVKHLVVRVTVSYSLHYLVLVYTTPESDWLCYDNGFYSEGFYSPGGHGIKPFRVLLGTKSAIEIIEMFLAEE